MKQIIITLLMLSSAYGFSQGGFVRAAEKYNNLNDIKAALQPYFERQRVEIGNEAFYHEGGEYTAYQHYLRFWEPILHPHGDFSKFYQAEETYWRQNPPQSKAYGNTDDWYELGPYSNNTSGQLGPFGSGHPMGIGPTEFVTINKNNHNELLSGSLNGGLYYSNNNGVTWTNAGSDSWEYSGCVHAVFHPTLNNVYYACSNKESLNSQPAYLGSQGAIKRKVGGSWETIGSYGDFGGAGGIWNKYYKILADPLNVSPAQRLYVATLKGLYFTDDGNLPASSVNWYKYNDPLLDGKIYDVEFVPNQTGTSSDKIVVTVYTEADYTWRVVYTVNKGASWQVLTSFPAFVLDTYVDTSSQTHIEDYDITDLMTIEVSEDDDNLLFIYTDVPGNGFRELYRYYWNTSTWDTLTTQSGANFGGGHSFGVSPVDADRISINKGFDIIVTTDGGANWTGQLFTGHDDVEDIVWHYTDNQTIYISNHGGVYKSTNTGSSFDMISQGLGIAEVLGLATSRTDAGRMAVGLNHDGTQVSLNNYTTSFVPEWHWRGQYADAFWPMIDYTDPDKIWSKAQWNGNSSFKYIDNITTSTGTGAGTNLFNSSYPSHVTIGAVAYGLGFTKVSQLNVEDPSIVYFNYKSSQTTDDLVRSKDYGATNKQGITDFSSAPYNMTVYSVHNVITDPNEPNTLYALVADQSSGANDFRLFRNTDVNNTNPSTVITSWVELGIPDSSRWVADIEVSYENSNRLYISYSSNVQNDPLSVTGNNMFFDIDYSSTTSCILNTNCFDHTNNLPNGHAGGHSLVLEKGTNEGVYFITNFGAYYSNMTDLMGGVRNWNQIGTNLPNVLPSGAEINYKINKIRISYKGRGVWEHDLMCPDDMYITESGIHLTDKFVEAFLQISSTAVVPSTLDVDYRGGYQVNLNPGFYAVPGSDFKAFIHPCDVGGNSFKGGEVISGETLEEQEENSTSIIEDSELTIFPNPSVTGNFTLKLADNMLNMQIDVLNVMGELIYSVNSESNTHLNLDISNYPRGMYLVRVQDNENSIVQKIIFQ